MIKLNYTNNTKKKSVANQDICTHLIFINHDKKVMAKGAVKKKIQNGDRNKPCYSYGTSNISRLQRRCTGPNVFQDLMFHNYVN